MFKISNMSDYACIALTALLQASGRSLSAQELANETGIAQPTISKVLKQLNECGMVESQRGVHGGYRAVKLPAEISLADVIRAIDGAPALTVCSQGHGDCRYADRCQLKGNWQVVNQAVADVLFSVTFEQMLQPMTLCGLRKSLLAQWSPVKERESM